VIDRKKRKNSLQKKKRASRTRNEELESKIEKLSYKKDSAKEKMSFFEKIRNRGSILETKPLIESILLSKTGATTRSVPIITKNIFNR
jgi:hypothetical protein